MSEEPRKRSRFDQAEPVVPRRSRFDQRERDRSRSPRRSVDPDNHRQRTRSPQASASPGAPLDAAAKIAEAKRRIDALAQAKQAPPPVDVPPIRSSATPDKSRKLSVSVTSEIYTQDGDYIKDIEVNDLRNRYTLTKGATQKMIKELTGADVTTRGEYYPDKSMATPSAPPLYLHITSTSREGLEKAVQKIEEMMRQDLPNLVDERRFRRREPEPFERDEHGRRKWPEERLPIDMEPIPGFNLRAQVVGAGGAYVKHIQQETSCKVQIKGRHSGFIETATGMESDEPMFLHITGPQKEQVEKAKELCIDLLKSVKQNYDAFKERGPSRGHGRDRDGQYGHGNRHDNYGGYGGYQGYGGQQSPTNGRSSGYGGQTASSGSADATDYAQAWAQYYAQNPAADPYAAYGGYEAYVQMYSQWYTQQGASQSPVAGTAGTSAPPGPPAEQPPPPPPSDSAPPPPPPPGSAPSYNSVPPPPGM